MEKSQVKNKKYFKKVEKMIKCNFKVVLGDICYPKSEALIIPSNTKGIMTVGRSARIIRDGLSGISKEAKQITKNNIIKVEECFITGPGRLNKRGLKKIYHAVIKRFQNDITSIFIMRNALNNAFLKVLDDKMKSVAVCGIGIEPGELDKKAVAVNVVEICRKFEDKIEIKIVDDDKEFIREVNNLLEI